MVMSKGDFNEVKNLLSEYKFNKVKLKNLNIDLNYLNEFEPNKVEHIQECKNKISPLENKINNIDRCLNELNDDEYKFIADICFNHKEYNDIIPLIKNKKGTSINPNTSPLTIISHGIKYKKSIINKLLKLNILGDAELIKFLESNKRCK